MSVITSDIWYNRNLYGNPGMRHVAGRTTDGTLVALFVPSDDQVHYATSADGLTWTDRGDLPPGTPGAGTPLFSPWASYHTELIRGTPDVLSLWLPGGGSLGTPDIYHYTVPWNPSTGFTGPTWTYATLLDVGGQGLVIAARRVGAQWHLAYSSTPAASPFVNWGLSLWQWQSGAAPYPVPGMGAAATTRFGLDLATDGATVYVVMADVSRGLTTLLPCPISGTSYTGTSSGLETVATGTGLVQVTLDNAGNPDVFYTTDGTTLLTTKRTGSHLYTPATPLANLNPLDARFSLLHDPATDNCWLAYSSAQTYSAGEVYLRARQAGTWRPASLVAGGDASGWAVPAFGPQTGPIDLAYVHGLATGPTGDALEYALIQNAAAPAKPSNLTTGQVAGPTPVLGYTYTDSAPNDGQQYQQVQVYADSAMTTLLTDTGQVRTASTSWTYSGPALAVNSTYYWRVRVWDTLTGGGLGTASPWSDLVPITIVRGGTVTIAAVTSGGSSSLSQLSAPTFTVTFTWNQADGHAAGTWGVQLLSADGSSVVDSEPTTAFSPPLAAGSSFTTPSFTSHTLLTGTSINLRVSCADPTTGLTSVSALLPLAVIFPPAAAPTSINVTPVPDAGYVTVDWVPGDSGAVSSVVAFRPSDATGPWTIVTKNPLPFLGTGPQTTNLHPQPTIPYDYQVWSVGGTDQPSGAATYSGVVLGLQGADEAAAFWLTCVDDPTISVALGTPDSDYSSLAWDYVEEEKTWVPIGATTPRSVFGRSDYGEGTQFKMWVPSDHLLRDGSVVTAQRIVDLMRTEMRLGRVLLFRDPIHAPAYVKLSKFHEEPKDGIHRVLGFVLRWTKPPTTLLY